MIQSVAVCKPRRRRRAVAYTGTISQTIERTTRGVRVNVSSGFAGRATAYRLRAPAVQNAKLSGALHDCFRKVGDNPHLSFRSHLEMLMTEAVDNTQPAPAMPMFYKNPVPIEPLRHATAGLRERADFRFAADTNAVPLTAAEIVHAARTYPIVFSA